MKKIMTTLTLIIGLIAAGPQANAAGSGQHSAQASTNAAQASAHMAAASGHAIVGVTKLASGAVAVPLMISGAVGKASGKAGEVLWNGAEIGKPLKVSDETVTAGPAPDQALEQKAY